MMKNLAIGRIVGLLLAVVGIGIGVRCSRESLRLNAEYHQWITARPMETAIDLSRPGKKVVPFQQTCAVSHGEAIILKCDLSKEARENLEETLSGLSGKVFIRDSKGHEIEIAEFNNRTARDWGGELTLTGFSPFATGKYLATIRVDSGASVLSNKEQTIYAKYQLCGLEQFPAVVTGAFALGAGLIGLVSALCVLPGLLNDGIRRRSQSEQQPTSKANNDPESANGSK